MNNRSYPFIARPLVCLVLLVAVFSCSKTKYEPLKRPYSKITRFAIAGYNDLDSINAVISDDEINVYWSAETERPATIKPTISLSGGATVSPASGEAVPFSESTVYTVTAEDGTTREYKLKPVINTAIPVLSAFDKFWLWQWATTDKLKINGEYFLNSGGASNIRAYAQRLRDGFEFDLEVDEEQTIQTQLVVDLPKFTAELDTGMHRIYVKVGDFPSNSLDVWIGEPVLSNVITSFTLEEAGQPIYHNDVITLTLNVGHKIDMDQFTKYFSKGNLGGIQFNMGYNTEPTETHYGAIGYNSPDVLSGIIMEGNQLKIPFTYGTGTPALYEPLFKGGTYINQIWIRFFYDYSYYGTPGTWNYERYKTLGDSDGLPSAPGSLFSTGPIGPHYQEMSLNFADETTKRNTILLDRD